MTAVVRFTPAATADLEGIWLTIAVDNPRAADRVIDEIHGKTEQLRDFPKSGQRRPEIDENARALVYGDYLILYRVANDSVDIIRIVHGARDRTALL